MRQLTWLSEASNKKRVALHDVHIIITQYKSEQSKRVAITFYSDALKKISKTGYIDIAKDNHRVYFREMPEGTGYKLNAGGRGHYATARVIHDKLPIFDKDVGDYNLFFDDEEKLYYINMMRTEQNFGARGK